VDLSFASRLKATVCLLIPVRSQEHAQWIWSSPLTELRIVGFVLGIMGPSLQHVTLPPTMQLQPLPHYFHTPHSSLAEHKAHVSTHHVFRCGFWVDVRNMAISSGAVVACALWKEGDTL
jgi:hypothetical protein